jgi:Trypsin-like peptidase domain
VTAKFDNARRAIIQVGNGRGFVVSAGSSRYIITAAHCLQRSQFPRPHLANGVRELTFKNILGPLDSKRRTVWAELCALSLCDDIAVFRQPDDQELSEEYEQYEEFTTAAMTIKRPETPGTVAWVLSLDGEWQSCTLHNSERFLSINQSDLVKSGMSGSPIINNSGAAVGLISTSGSGSSVNPNLMGCLPPWLLRRIKGRPISILKRAS